MNGDDITQIFDVGGLLSQCIENYEYRESQLNMAQDVLSCYEKPSVYAIEAGTGIGKSFSYLIPALFYAFDDPQDRTVIATSTINLQKQLIEKDLPTLFRMFDKNCNIALAVGRNNYLCLRRLAEEMSSIPLFQDDETSEISRINAFANSSETGLRTDYPARLDSNFWNTVCSDADFCLASKCPYFSQCFYFKSKKELSNASIIICNHHLLFVDSNSRHQTCTDYSEDCILPPFRHLVIDEAHNIERHATDLFTNEYSSYLLRHQTDYIYDPRLKNTKALRMLEELSSFCSDKKLPEDIINYFSVVNSNAETLNMALLNQLEYSGLAHILLTKSNVQKILSDVKSTAESLLSNAAVLVSKLSAFSSKLSVPEEKKARVDELNVHTGRIKDVLSVLKSFLNVSEWTDDVYYLETEKHGQFKYVTFKIAPIKVSDILRDALFSKVDSVVLTSATLDLHDDFNFFATSVGLPVDGKLFVKRVYDSPFDYRHRLMLLTPYDAPDFNKDNVDEYASYLINSVYDAVSSSGGGSLVLFTSIKLMEYVYENLSPRFANINLKCMKQGDKDRYSLLQDFISDTDSVLFATDSFWEGVDAPGNTLRLVIITKLPFRMPDEPIYKARYAMLEKNGMSGFFCLSLPDATMRLKQGYGRLMRHTSDKGIVLILDSRIVTRSYGSMMLSSLPESYHPDTSLDTVNQKIESFLF